MSGLSLNDVVAPEEEGPADAAAAGCARAWDNRPSRCFPESGLVSRDTLECYLLTSFVSMSTLRCRVADGEGAAETSEPADPLEEEADDALSRVRLTGCFRISAPLSAEA